MLVSIIIPVYNVEKYLIRCVESALSQTYSLIEIILIDDGSTDHSSDICDEIGKTDPRVLVIHKENGGLSSARNAGIEISKGDALFFLDSDDYLSRDCIEKCVRMIQRANADISIIQMMYIPEETNDEIKEKIDVKEELFTAEKAIESSLYQVKFSCNAQAKLFLRNVIGDIRFPHGKISEDLATCHLFFKNAGIVVCSNEHEYYYRQRNNSIMHEFHPKRMDALKWAQEIEQFCETYYPGIMNAAMCRTFNVAIHLLLDLPENGEIHRQFSHLLWKEIRRTRMNVICNSKARKREKIAALLSYFGEHVLVAVWNSKLAVSKGHV